MINDCVLFCSQYRDDQLSSRGAKDRSSNRAKFPTVHFQVALLIFEAKLKYLEIMKQPYVLNSLIRIVDSTDRKMSNVFGLVVWLSGNALVAINEVTLRQARLILGWVTVCGQVHHLGM